MPLCISVLGLELSLQRVDRGAADRYRLGHIRPRLSEGRLTLHSIPVRNTDGPPSICPSGLYCRRHPVAANLHGHPMAQILEAGSKWGVSAITRKDAEMGEAVFANEVQGVLRMTSGWAICLPLDFAGINQQEVKGLAPELDFTQNPGKVMDDITFVRSHWWLVSEGFSLSTANSDVQKLPATLYHRIADSLAYAA